MRARLIPFAVIASVWLSGLDLALAQSTPQPLIQKVLSGDLTGSGDYPSTFTLGGRIWLSQGKLAYNIQGSGGQPNVLSELIFQGQNIPIYELAADLAIQRFVANLSLGYGAISSKGTLQDLDWTNNNRTCTGSPIPGTVCSNTLSPSTDGQVWYVSLDVGPRLLRWKYADQVGAADLLLGFQYWTEKYSAKGIVDISGGGARDQPTTVTALTETVQWISLRLGPKVAVPLFSQAELPVLTKVQLVGSLFYVPYTYYRNDDNHNLRTDLKHDPSFIDIATGEGIQMEGAARLTLWQSLTFEAGYRYWDMKTTGGTSTAFGSNGTVSVTNLNQANARRQGVFFSLLWTF
ncbi:MAG: hypothetical protein AB1411_04075 [Nitrospirota bacterium]